MPKQRLIKGQRVTSITLQGAKSMRHQMTPEEATLWQALRANKVAGLHFRRQQIIDGFIADFYCSSAGLVIEVDGASHNGKEGYDAERDRIMRARGLSILRIPAQGVRNDLAAVVERILEAANKASKR